MNKILILFLSLVIVASALGTAAADEDNNTVANDTINANVSALNPTANAIVANSGNSENTNINTIIVKSTNLNRQVQVQRTRSGVREIIVYYVPKTINVKAATVPEGAETNATGSSVPMESTGLSPTSGIIGVLGVLGGLLASRLKFGS
jgi:hypothetical protein